MGMAKSTGEKTGGMDDMVTRTLLQFPPHGPYLFSLAYSFACNKHIKWTASAIILGMRCARACLASHGPWLMHEHMRCTVFPLCMHRYTPKRNKLTFLSVTIHIERQYATQIRLPCALMRSAIHAIIFQAQFYMYRNMTAIG